METRTLFVAVAVFLACLSVHVRAAFRKEDCEACVDFIEAFKEDVKDVDDSLRSDIDAMDGLLKKFCKNVKEKPFKRVCEFIGGYENSPAPVTREVSKPVMGHVPSLIICERLNKKYPQICEVRIKKKRNLGDVDLKKMRVKELKNILNDWDQGDACKGCAEKSDFVAKVIELMPQYDPDSWKVRQAKQEL